MCQIWSILLEKMLCVHSECVGMVYQGFSHFLVGYAVSIKQKAGWFVGMNYRSSRFLTPSCTVNRIIMTQPNPTSSPWHIYTERGKYASARKCVIRMRVLLRRITKAIAQRSFVDTVIRVMLSPTLVLIGLVLGSASLQLQSASAYRYRGRVRAQSSISLIPNVEQYFQVSY